MGITRTASVLVAIALCCAALVACPLSDAAAETSDAPQIVVTTSILECAVRDVAGGAFGVYRLVPPHSCPGHFDMTAADLERVVNAPMFIRHDYQSYLDAKLGRAGKRAKRCVVVPSRGAQTIPKNYIAVCRQARDALSELAPDKAPALKRRFADVSKRVKNAEAEVTAKAARLKGKVVVASRLQKGFCKWMGLTIAATFDNADQASLRGIEQTVRQAAESNASAVVCNLQRGLREGRALAQRLRLPVIVLSNFPEAGEDGGGYLGLLRGNVAALVRGLEGD